MDVEQLEQRELRKKQFLVAALFALALAFAMVFAYWMGAFGFGPSRAFYINYDFAGGLDQGSPVRLAGIKVGRVTNVLFTGDPTVLKLRVEMSKEAYSQITEDSKFFVNLAGLIGERYIEVVPGNGAVAKNGHTFRGIDPPRIDQLISQGYGIFGDLRALFNENKGDIKEMLTSLNDLTKNLNKLLSSATPEQRHQLARLLDNFAAMSQDLRQMVGNLNSGVNHMQSNGAAESWTRLRSLLGKADRIELNDIRRLMLEDGVKINFATKKIESSVSR